MTGATLRGLLVAFCIAAPALLLPGVAADTSQITILVALLAGFLTFTEYNSNFPSIVEFRYAPPFNRLRFISLYLMVLTLTVILAHQVEPTLLTGAVFSVASKIGNLLDFPFSPVRLIVLMLPPETDPRLVSVVRGAAGVSYGISLLTLLAFLYLVRLRGWPTRRGAFNVWVNLPLFDPTSGGDVLDRLQRDARVNIALGFLLPFVIPAVVKLAADLLDPVSLAQPQTIIWTLTAWAFIPASMILRGIAMARIAAMIQKKRRRAYASAQAEGEKGLQAA